MSSIFPDDTALDAIAAQVRSTVPLDIETVAELLGMARRDPGASATGRLVEHQLGVVMEAVLARRGAEMNLMDLYQEGSIAATVAVREYAARGGDPAGLTPYVRRVVDTFLDETVEREAAQRLADTLLVERVKLLEAAEVALRRRLDREPTDLELAAALDWGPDEVEVVRGALVRARVAHDAEIVAYLDDLEDGDPGGTPDI